ncbi:hypothetical protein [Streptomyces spiralis]|uniref:hypothetical protein n=1 Tax=Streptomyces spiralis TaxID=66376 RepID=UPI0036A58FE3
MAPGTAAACINRTTRASPDQTAYSLEHRQGVFSGVLPSSTPDSPSAGLRATRQPDAQGTRSPQEVTVMGWMIITLVVQLAGVGLALRGILQGCDPDARQRGNELILKP